MALHEEAIHPNIQVSSRSFQILARGWGAGVTVVLGEGLHRGIGERSLFQMGLLEKHARQ